MDEEETMLLMSHVELNESYADADCVELNEEEEMALMASVEKHGINREDAWFIDSGCSNHVWR